jgi:tRNA 2-thiouridine synthesizing protein C
MTKRLLSLHRRPPGGEAKEALDAVLVAAVFDQEVTLLFREQGVWQLVAGENSEEMIEAIHSLPDYGVSAVHVCEASLRAAALTPDQLLVPVKMVSSAAQTELLGQQDMVLCD